MNGPRDEFFTGTRFAANQHRRIAAGDLGHSGQDRGERGRGADNLFEHRGLVDFLSKRNVSCCSLSSALLRSSISVYAIYHRTSCLWSSRSGLERTRNQR